MTARTRMYQSELAAFEAAIVARQAAVGQLGEAILEIERARRSQDDEAFGEAQRRAQADAREIERLDGRVTEVEARLESARTRLLAALDARLDRLQDQLLNETDPLEQARIDTFVEDLQNQYRELDQQAERGIEVLPEFYPALNADPRDGPTEWRIKAELLERRAETAEAQITAARDEVSRLESRLRLQRVQEDSRANRDRFGDALPPVGNRLGQAAGEIVADTTGIPLERLPLDQQIVLWEAYIGQLEALRDRVSAMAGEFRRRLSRTAVWGGVA